jgi:hypothetical protein
MVLLRSANPAEFLAAGLVGGGAGPHALHGRVLHRNFARRRDVDWPRPVAGGPRARHDLCSADAPDRAAASRAPDDTANERNYDAVQSIFFVTCLLIANGAMGQTGQLEIKAPWARATPGHAENGAAY